MTTVIRANLDDGDVAEAMTALAATVNEAVDYIDLADY